MFLEIEEFKGMENLKSDEKFGALKKIAESLELPLGNDFSAKKPYLFLTSDQNISKEKQTYKLINKKTQTLIICALKFFGGGHRIRTCGCFHINGFQVL